MSSKTCLKFWKALLLKPFLVQKSFKKKIFFDFGASMVLDFFFSQHGEKFVEVMKLKILEGSPIETFFNVKNWPNFSPSSLSFWFLSRSFLLSCPNPKKCLTFFFLAFSVFHHLALTLNQVLLFSSFLSPPSLFVSSCFVY